MMKEYPRREALGCAILSGLQFLGLREVRYDRAALDLIDGNHQYSYSQPNDLRRIVLTMFRAIVLQVGAVIITSIAAGLLVGVRGAVSAALAGGACALPNLLFALRLHLVANRPGASYPANFFLGEFVKIAATIGLLVFAVQGYADLHWPSMLIGLVLASQAGFLAFWKKS